MHKRIGLSLLILLSASLALYSASVPIGVLQGRGDTSMPTALANAGFTNVTVINLDLLTANKVDLTQYKVVVYAPDIYPNDPASYTQVASQFTKVSRILHTGKINVLMMGQPYTHVYDFIPFYQCTYPCSGASLANWDISIADPSHALLKYPNVLTQSDLTSIGTGANHYIVQRAGNSYMDGRVVLNSAGDYPLMAEMRWGVGKVVVNSLNNGCIGKTCAAPYYKLLQNMVAYLSSVDIAGPLRSGLNGTAITVTDTTGQGVNATLVLPTWVTADAPYKPLVGDQATFTITGTYPGTYIIQAVVYNALGNKTGEGYYRIGFVMTNTAPRIALIEPTFSSATEFGFDMMGYEYTVFDNYNINKLNLSKFDLLVYDLNIQNTEPPFHTPLANMLTSVTNWVNAGGKVLLYHQYGVYPDSYAPISTPGGAYSAGWWTSWTCGGWGTIIVNTTHQFVNWPHMFDNANLSNLFTAWCHRMYNGINGIEGEHPFSYDISQSYQYIGIKTYGSGKLLFSVLEPQWFWHSTPTLNDEKMHDNLINYQENSLFALSQNFPGFIKSYYDYMVRVVRCAQIIQNANVTILLPGTSTVVDSGLTDANGYAVVHVDYGTYDVKLTLPDSTTKTYSNQVFN